ncbi:carboxypeptidase regulatory-like domain-containing protein [Candidatus Bipolaricaulota bacterium]|nr:carboxypeptidase regulatory-like domain-containing protein [Candidatus Bipolaricaulota bacterium]
MTTLRNLGVRERRIWFGISSLIVGSLIIALLGLVPGAANDLTITGIVVDDDGPIPGVTVRIQATEHFVTTDIDGRFVLSPVAPAEEVTVTAWARDYFVGWTTAIPGGEPVTITIRRHYTTDNPEYTWFSMEGAEGSASCGQCMPTHYAEWLADAHSQSAVNVRFLTMYNGTDIHSNQSPLTRYAYSRDYGAFPLPPNPEEPYYGPGYKLDFPNTDGNCGACHIPAAAAYPGMAYAVNPNDLCGIEPEGIFCEFCHKIGDVILDPETLLPYPNMPGVLSIQLFRSEGEQVLFFGTFDDVTRRVTRLPLEEESAFCAPCHFGVFWDTVIYDSYGEWLRSPYSDPDTGQTCQDCHMPVTDDTWFALPEKGGFIREPGRIFNHTMPGASDVQLLQDAVTMDVRTYADGSTLRVDVSVTNHNTGHHVPTDSPLRHMILLVEAVDASGEPLPLLDGPILPSWCGEGDPADGYYAGLPGKAFAKILEEHWTGISPSGAYWNPTRIVSDNRIAAFKTDTSNYVFELTGSDSANVTATLLFRRAFAELMDQKGWDVPDILMEEYKATLRLNGDVASDAE